MFSDAVIRVFRTCAERVAPEAALQAYEADLSVSSIPTQVEDIKTEDIVGPSAILSPGEITHTVDVTLSYNMLFDLHEIQL